MKQTICFLSILALAIPGLKIHQEHKLEARARLAADFLHRKLDLANDDFHATLVVHYANRGSTCIDYVDADQGVPYVGRALLHDGSDLLTWGFDEDDPDWIDSCAPGLDHNVQDLTETVRVEDR